MGREKAGSPYRSSFAGTAGGSSRAVLPFRSASSLMARFDPFFWDSRFARGGKYSPFRYKSGSEPALQADGRPRRLRQRRLFSFTEPTSHRRPPCFGVIDQFARPLDRPVAGRLTGGMFCHPRICQNHDAGDFPPALDHEPFCWNGRCGSRTNAAPRENVARRRAVYRAAITGTKGQRDL